MDPLFLRKRLINSQLNRSLENIKTSNIEKSSGIDQNQPTEINVQKQTEHLIKNMRSEILEPTQLKLNYLASMERSGYIKKVMNLPETLPELLMQLQNEDTIADDLTKFKQKKQQEYKPDLTEGAIRNAEKSFNEVLESGVNKGVNNTTETPKPVITENKPNIPQQNINQEIANDRPIPQPIVDNKPVPQPNNNKILNQVQDDHTKTKPIQQPVVELKSGVNEGVNEGQLNNPTESPKPIIAENKPNIPQQNINQEIANDRPIPQPIVDNKPVPQPNSNEILNQVQDDYTKNKPIQQPSVEQKQEWIATASPRNDEIKQPTTEPQKPIQQPAVDNKPEQTHKHPQNNMPATPDKPQINTNMNLQEYMRYEMLKPSKHPHPHRPHPDQPQLPPPPPHHAHGPHHFGHHHPPKPPEKPPVDAESMAAMQVLQNMQQVKEPSITEMRQRLSGDATELFFTGLINLNNLADELKTNSKSAKSKLILAMSNASKQGVDNSQINDTLKHLSESMATVENATPAKILKNIIELYLPWYPLQQGVGFDLSIETTPEEEDYLSVLKVWIQTKNFGNINALLTLITTNSVDMSIKCATDFPKDDLVKRINEETQNRTMQSTISVDTVEQIEGYNEQQAKVNMSSTYELNPYLLLMAHSFIKNTIVIDTNSLV